MSSVIVLALAGLATLIAPALRAQSGSSAKKPPDARALAEQLFAIDALDARLCVEVDRIARQLSVTRLSKQSDVDAWSARCGKLAAKRVKLETASGAHHLWEKPAQRGLYIVGGETRAPKGLLISMHGGGAGSGDAWSAHGATDAAAAKLDWLAIHPEVLEKTELGWTDSGSEEFVIALVEAALRTWKIDRDKVFFTGHSMGGYGTWTIGAHHADRVAGLAASAGAPSPVLDANGNARSLVPGVIPNLRNVPIVIYQSDDDPNVPPTANRLAAKKLAEAQARWGGFMHEYWEVPGRAHDLPPGGFEALLAKVADKRRGTRPTKVLWQPALRWKRQFYWLFWDAPIVGVLIEAEIDRSSNTVHIKSAGARKGLEVLVDDELLDVARPIVVTFNGAEVFRGACELDLGTLARTWLAGDPALSFARRIVLPP